LLFFSKNKQFLSPAFPYPTKAFFCGDPLNTFLSLRGAVATWQSLMSNCFEECEAQLRQGSALLGMTGKGVLYCLFFCAVAF
jgi:hypothetical protein